jgi:lipoate---protein ligase
MICIDSTITDPYFNLAAEEYLLKRSTQNVLMIWQSEPCVIIGRHQSVETEVNLPLAKELRVKIARRSSGGGAVYDDLGNMNFTFIESSKIPNFSKYSTIMIHFLENFGVRAQVDKRGGLAVDGLKISGSAQAIWGNRIMFHASLLFSTDLLMLNAILEGKKDLSKDTFETGNKRYVKSVRSKVSNLSNYLTESMPINEFKQQLIKNILNKNLSDKLYTFNDREKEEIAHLRDKKYSTTNWNLYQSRLTNACSVNFKT